MNTNILALSLVATACSGGTTGVEAQDSSLEDSLVTDSLASGSDSTGELGSTGGSDSDSRARHSSEISNTTDQGQQSDSQSQSDNSRSIPVVVETSNGVFFEPRRESNDFILFFPRFETVLEPVRGPQGNLWLVTVRKKTVSVVDPGDVLPEWQGRELVPYTFVPDHECTLKTIPGMYPLRQLHSMQGKDVSYATPNPLCQFSVLVHPNYRSQALEQIRNSISDQSMITYDITIAGKKLR